MDLSTQVGPLTLKNPIILASGTYGLGNFTHLSALGRRVSQLGGFITKTITLKERLGNLPPRIIETASGIINSVGLENPGIEQFCRANLDNIARLRTTKIISIGGITAEEIAEAIRILQKYHYRVFDAIELNISCPNINKAGFCIAQSPKETKKTVQKVSNVSKLPLIVKLSPNVTDVTKIARAALDAGARIISLINTISALSINWRQKKSMLGGFTGGLSGPAIKPIALKMVYEVTQKTNAEVIGIGGIMHAEDVLEFLSVGARAVQVGTLNLVNPFAVFCLPQEIKKKLSNERTKSIKNFISDYRIE
jgi:dihydroorotate dehydrogenase (NAD+) catalytic subunit